MVPDPDPTPVSPRLRIIPGKVSGEPHLENSRITTRAIHALYERMGDFGSVANLYPHVAYEALEQAVNLEHVLAA